ncbi:MAG: prepilin peptidase [Candidatus Paceibacterota bacterium]
MFYYLATVIFVVGTIIGSFLNVVALRLNTGKGLMGRSFCMSCGRTIKSYDLFPILSFLCLGGRSRCCKTKISAQYPLVEFITGIVFLSIFLKFYNLDYVPMLVSTFWYLAFCILIVLTIYDIRHQIIPDILSYTFTFLSLIYFVGNKNLASIFSYPEILNLLAGPMIFVVFSAIWFVSKGRWIGFGDGKLALGMGFALGLSQSLSAIAFAFWIGALWSIFILLFQKLGIARSRFNFRSAVPFAPFMIAGFFLAFILGADVFSLNALIFSNVQ